MENILIEHLNKAKREHKLVTIRTNKYEISKFNVGYILDFNEELLNYKAVSPLGLSDGIQTIQLKDLYQIDLDDKYLRRIEKRIQESNRLFTDKSTDMFFSDAGYGVFELLKLSKETKQMIFINFYHDLGMYGYVLELNETEFAYKVYNDFGEYDGISVCKVEDVKNIIWNDIDIRSVEILK